MKNTVSDEHKHLMRAKLTCHPWTAQYHPSRAGGSASFAAILVRRRRVLNVGLSDAHQPRQGLQIPQRARNILINTGRGDLRFDRCLDAFSVRRLSYDPYGNAPFHEVL